MNLKGTMALFQYWNRLRGDRPAPRRTEIEPGDIRQLLADTFILETDARGEAVFRLAGTRLCATYGRELKGFGFTLIWASRDQPMMARLARNVFSDASVVVVTFIGRSSGGRSAAFEMLLLPLETGGTSQRIIGCVQAARNHFWLGADPVFENRIETVRVVDPEREPLFLKNRPAVSVPAAEAEPDSAPSHRRFRHLVVIEGGKEIG